MAEWGSSHLVLQFELIDLLLQRHMCFVISATYTSWLIQCATKNNVSARPLLHLLFIKAFAHDMGFERCVGYLATRN